MTLTLSPEVEADIRELLMAWEWREPGVVEVEAAAIGILKDGVALAISNAREAKAIRARVGLSEQVVPDARVFEETDVPYVIPDGAEWANANCERFVWRGGRHGEWIPLPEREEGGAK